MTNKRHTIDYYMDGFKAIPFCKNCSLEADALLNECAGTPPVLKLDTRQKDSDNERDYLDSKSSNY